MSSPSYHDVFITTEDLERISIFDLPYGYVIRCTRVRGWSLWKEDILIAEEYTRDKWLVLDVAGHVIVDSRHHE